MTSKLAAKSRTPFDWPIGKLSAQAHDGCLLVGAPLAAPAAQRAEQYRYEL